MIGPSLPGQTSNPSKEDADSPSTSQRMMGPMLPDNNQEKESSQGMSSAAKEFMERQERIRIASEHNNGSASRITKQPEQRPDWMLAPPSASGISDMFKQDPSAALKSRGFNQSSNMRVQRTATVPTNPDDIDSASWTETPQDRAKRLYEEQMGIRDINGTKPSHLQSQQLEDERKREERIRQAVQEHQASRGPSLLEQHQAKRRKDLRSKEHRSDRDNRHKRHHSRRSKGSDEEESQSNRHHRHRRERSQSVSDDGQKHSSSRDKHSENGKSRRHSEDRHRSRHHSSHSSSRRTHRSRSRSRSPSKERDPDRSRAKKREEKEFKREKERKKRRREEEEREEKRGAPTMIWDREAALSVGGQLMDERKRTDFIKSSALLSDRFGQGSSRYICSGEGTNQKSNPAAAVVSPSSSTEWINNVLINFPSVSHNSIPVHNEAHENRVASPQSSANSFGRVDDATAVSSKNHQSIRENILATLPDTQEISLENSSTSKPLRKYTYKEGTRKSKEAKWRIHDHERWLRHTTKKAIKRRMERKGFKADKESDTDRIRFNLKRLKENNPFKYTKELHDASIWKHNKNAPFHGRKLIKKFEQIQPEPTMKELEEAHLEHRLHKCLGRRERYNAVRKQNCTSNNANV